MYVLVQICVYTCNKYARIATSVRKPVFAALSNSLTVKPTCVL